MDTSRFYDDIAAYYDLIFEDWEASMERQGGRIDQLIDAHLPVSAFAERIDVLDISAGIGTQSLPLARRGYRVTARDISPAALHRLAGEAAFRGLNIHCEVGDMRHPPSTSQAAFDVLLTFDNSLPHLLSDKELLIALRAGLNQLRVGGVFLGSVRDYSAVSRTPKSVHPYGERTRDGVRYRLRQEWTWIDEHHYDATMIIEQLRLDEWIETIRTSMRYYAVPVDRLLALMEEAGFTQVSADYTQFYQPIVIGHRAA